MYAFPIPLYEDPGFLIRYTAEKTIGRTCFKEIKMDQMSLLWGVVTTAEDQGSVA